MRAMQQRQRDPGVTRQYQQKEMKRSAPREAIRPLFEAHRNDVTRGAQQQRSSKQFKGGGDSQRVQRDAAPSRQAQRSVDRSSSKQGRSDVVKMKGGGNGRGNGKH